ncbi:MAG: hypothetical protein GY711_01845 [bacterium]|nr:hypothetical protein [bacterium]
MHDRLRRAGVIALVAVFTVYSYAPLLRAGFVGDDLATAVELGERVRAGTWPGAVGELYTLAQVEPRPVATLSLLVSSRLAAPDGKMDLGAARWLRGEGLLLLFLAALGLTGALRRSLAPWFGQDQARAAGIAAAVLFLLHPLCVSTVARIASRGDLLVVALGAWSLRLFLRGRQNEEYGYVAGACLIAMVAGGASRLAIFLPLLCAGMEYVSARRHRKRMVRARTALTTFVVFGVCVGLEWGARILFAPEGTAAFAPWRPTVDGHPVGLAETAALGVEKLGVLMLPVNTFGIGAIGYVFAGVAALLALHPGFVAARAAPRMWGRILLGWVVSIAATEGLEPALRVLPESLTGGHLLFAPALVMAVGFGISSTAISGARRSALPAAIGFFYALLAHGNAVPVEEASQGLAALRTRVFDEARRRGWDRDFLMIDPPHAIAGVDVIRPALPYLFAASFLPADAPPEAAQRRVRGSDLAAFRAFVREPEFTAWRAAGAVVLVPAGALPGSGEGTIAVELPAPEPSEGRMLWRETGRSPSGIVLEALRARSIRVVGLPSARTADAPVVRWSASSGVANIDEVTGAWLESPSGPVAIFDLEQSLDWLFADRVRSVWFTGALSLISSAQASPGPPALAGDPVPRIVGEDWLFDLGPEPPPAPALGEVSWILGVFDLEKLEYEELPLRVESEGRLRAVGVVPRVDEGTEHVWYLDYRVDGVTVARASGRRG